VLSLCRALRQQSARAAAKYFLLIDSSDRSYRRK
jgi:hypothetical protein